VDRPLIFLASPCKRPPCSPIRPKNGVLTKCVKLVQICSSNKSDFREWQYSVKNKQIHVLFYNVLFSVVYLTKRFDNKKNIFFFVKLEKFYKIILFNSHLHQRSFNSEVNEHRIAPPSGHKAISTPNLNNLEQNTSSTFERDSNQKSFRKFFRYFFCFQNFFRLIFVLKCDKDRNARKSDGFKNSEIFPRGRSAMWPTNRAGNGRRASMG